MFDFQNRRAIAVEGHEDAIMTLTTVQDLASTVAKAVEHEGEWPVHGGIQGNKLAASEIISIGERVRGMYSLHSVQHEATGLMSGIQASPLLSSMSNWRICSRASSRPPG